MNPAPLAHRRGGRVAAALAALAVMVLAGALASWVGAVGVTRYVDAGAPCPGAGTPANPYCKIQDAICASGADDTVSVAPGTYLEAIRIRPAVSVMSQGGPSVTTISAAGQPCTDNTFCAKRTGSQCSTVTFPSGTLPTSRIEGFTITGGGGLPQSAWVAGGGLFVFGPATVVNNIITNNVLTGPAPQNEDMRGAGVYVAIGTPVITGNTITGNAAIPPAGISGNPTFGYGGGVWLGFQSSATLRGNDIHDNAAGDPDLTFSVGAGGGVVVFPPSGTVGPVVDRNLIADNFADTFGGGVGIMSIIGTTAEAVVTNNVITGNVSTYGGGFYAYFSKSRAVNNTITGNEAFLGGGAYTGLSDPNLPIALTNNIIVGNTLRDAGNGGGVYSNPSPAFTPALASNDLWGNEKNQCAGDLTDPGCIGVSGNFASNPLFVNGPGGDFHLATGSPAIDRALAAAAPSLDFEGRPRGFDGNGIPNNPATGDVDIGAFEFGTGCIPSPEVCDGADNDCNTLIDEGFPNTDGDGLANCIDPDDDNDAAADAADCAPLDATAFGVPVEVSGDQAAGAGPTTLSFDMQNIGSGTRYEIISGLLSRLWATGDFQEDFCVAASAAGSPWNDNRPEPGLGDGWYYLIRSFNACGLGTLGGPLRDGPGAGDVCQAGVFDQDADGSPDDLDCNDTNPNVSPIEPEVCNGVDEDCDLQPDDGLDGQICGTDNGECQTGLTSCSQGTMTCVGEIGPAPELCDGLDNNCNLQVDDNVVDSDMDGQDDCLDQDDDNDMVLDPGDCAPRDATAFGMPVEVQDLDVLSGIPTEIVWVGQAIGSGTVYDVASGLLTVPGSADFAAASCVTTLPSSPGFDHRPAPAEGTVWYYLVKSRNACGQGTYGSPARDTIPACP